MLDQLQEDSCGRRAGSPFLPGETTKHDRSVCAPRSTDFLVLSGCSIFSEGLPQDTCSVQVVNVHEGPELSLPGGLAPFRVLQVSSESLEMLRLGVVCFYE